MTRRFQDVWKEQCAAVRRIMVGRGIKSAFDYVVGERLLTFADV